MSFPQQMEMNIWKHQEWSKLFYRQIEKVTTKISELFLDYDNYYFGKCNVVPKDKDKCQSIDNIKDGIDGLNNSKKNDRNSNCKITINSNGIVENQNSYSNNSNKMESEFKMRNLSKNKSNSKRKKYHIPIKKPILNFIICS